MNQVGVRDLRRTSRAISFCVGRGRFIDPTTLRSLDALHLATALSIREEVGVFVTYDQCLAAAASGQGLAVSQPS